MGCGSIYYAKKSCESSIVTDIGAQNRYDLNFAPAGLKMKNELSTPNWTMIPGQGRTVRAPPNNFIAGLARLRRHAWQVWAVGGRREAPESAVCSATVVGSIVFHNHNAIAATPHPSPVLCDTFSHRLPALVSWDSPLR